ncbi:thrombospondin type 3 repeat-containing protein [Candidatus Gracilibacteria bacterium]|nr:thrombospondin type 3 repeat-containing protein [Candidatus Gracilibacteria bacterium]
MIKKILSISALLLSSFFVQNSFAAAPLSSDFPYERKVILSPLAEKAEVALSLQGEILQKISQRFSNADLFNQENEEVPFVLFYDEISRLKQENIKVLSVSSQKEDPITYLADEDPFTTYSFDEKVDGKNDSWFVLDLGQSYPLVRLNLFKPDRAQIRFVQIQGGETLDSMKTLVSKRAYSWQYDFNASSIRYLKVSLWGAGIKLDDIKLYKGESAQMYFTAEPEKEYKLLYGGTTDLIRYKERVSQLKPSIPFVQMTKEQDNPLFPQDFDGDGYDNNNDNCPFISNPLQKDSDEDRVGNDCDNAVDVKNSNQYDTDYDGVGDVVDNCKLIPNLDQGDRDDDGYGDACDNAHAVENSEQLHSLSLSSIGLATGVGIILLAIVFVAWKFGILEKISNLKK